MGSKSAGNQVVTNRLDPNMERRTQEAWERARGVANQAYTPYTGQGVANSNGLITDAGRGYQNAAGQFGNVYGQSMTHQLGDRQFGSNLDPNHQFTDFSTMPYEQAGFRGAQALSGDQAAMSSLMNPYMDKVVGAMGKEYDRMRDKSVMEVNDIATKGGAFGGDRAALLQGERLGALDRAQASDISNLLHGGFNEAMGRAGQLANLGLGAGQIDLGQGSLHSQYRLGAGAQDLQAQGMGADYASEQGRQRLAALQQAQQAAQGGMGAAAGQLAVGDYNRQLEQQRLDYARNQFEQQRDWGLRGVNVMNSTMSGMPYGTTESQPLTRNAGAGILGGAMTGAQLGSMIPGGTIPGMIGGGILGLFG